VSSEANERLPRGPKGDCGEQGIRGMPGMSRGARHGFAYLSILMLLLAGANLLWTSLEVRSADTKAQAQCQFDADLGGAPVTVDPRTGKASLLAVTIISDARTAWRQSGCPGRLAAPSPSFRQWAAHYRLPAG